MTGARRSSSQTSRLNSMISRIGEVATTEAVRKPPMATSGGADQSGGEISTAISPTTSPAPIVPTVSPLMMTSAVPLSMAYIEYPVRPSAASDCPAGISASDAMLATAASSSSGKPAKKRIAASRKVSIFCRLHRGSCLRDLGSRPLLRAAHATADPRPVKDHRREARTRGHLHRARVVPRTVLRGQRARPDPSERPPARGAWRLAWAP
jgi:hypothetical protein